MQYHALALAAEGAVDLVGPDHDAPDPAVAGESRIRVHTLAPWPARDRTRGEERFRVVAFMLTLRRSWQIASRLLRLPRPDVILVQTPPATPTLAVVWMVARLRRARLVIDWQNLAHMERAARVGDQHRRVRSLRRVEQRWARRADAHLAASRALATWLARELHVAAVVVHDGPRRGTARLAPLAAIAERRRIVESLGVKGVDVPLAVAPTRWTADEDVDLLIETLERTDRGLRSVARDGEPRLVVLLTGTGDGRTAFEQRLARRQFSAIAVTTACLSPADNAQVTAAASLGLCLHQSSSGLDLPIELSDFRGAGVPVCVYDFAPVLSERFTNGQDGAVLRDAGALAAALIALGSGPSVTADALTRSRQWMAGQEPEWWDDHWVATARQAIVSQP